MLGGGSEAGCGAPQRAESLEPTARCRETIASLRRTVDAVMLEFKDRNGKDFSPDAGKRISVSLDAGIEALSRACDGVDMASPNNPIVLEIARLNDRIRILERMMSGPSAGADEYK